ncbi:hypothetical protein BDV93DRAFT_542171 [Ceratobasidium sp. AG-I]|nr:hypothetical protein BDV93DRAFT_542171 [Ceratobasidium sp. AG-I]
MSENPPSSSIALFQPPAGGDITLRSSDGTSFRAHSILMSLASSVFHGMLSVGVQGDGLIDLAEDAESVSLMLEHIYPVKSPNLQSIGEYAKCLEIARKYDVKGMMDTLNEQLCWGERNGVVNANPIEACILADTFGLPNASEVAARIVDFRVNLRDSGELVDGLGKFPQWKLPVRLVGKQAARAEALARILFTFDQYPMDEFAACGDNENQFLLCDMCEERAAETPVSAPTWLLRWSMAVYNLALNHDLQALPDEVKVTNPDSVPRLINYQEGEDRWPMCCNYCVAGVQSHEKYSSWAGVVVNVIQKCTAELDNTLSLS